MTKSQRFRQPRLLRRQRKVIQLTAELTLTITTWTLGMCKSVYLPSWQHGEELRTSLHALTKATLENIFLISNSGKNLLSIWVIVRPALHTAHLSTHTCKLPRQTYIDTYHVRTSLPHIFLLLVSAFMIIPWPSRRRRRHHFLSSSENSPEANHPYMNTAQHTEEEEEEEEIVFATGNRGEFALLFAQLELGDTRRSASAFSSPSVCKKPNCGEQMLLWSLCYFL